jgi:hypothetical protein
MEATREIKRKVVPVHAVKAHGGVEVQLHWLLNLAQDRGEWEDTCPGHFTPRERAIFTHWIGGWASPSTSWDILEKKKKICCPSCELNHFSSVIQLTVHSLCWLCSPGYPMYGLHRKLLIFYIGLNCTCMCVCTNVLWDQRTTLPPSVA